MVVIGKWIKSEWFWFFELPMIHRWQLEAYIIKSPEH